MASVERKLLSPAVIAKSKPKNFIKTTLCFPAQMMIYFVGFAIRSNQHEWIFPSPCRRDNLRIQQCAVGIVQ